MELSDLYMICHSLLISDVKFHMLPHITLCIVRGFKFAALSHKKKKAHPGMFGDNQQARRELGYAYLRICVSEIRV